MGQVRATLNAQTSSEAGRPPSPVGRESLRPRPAQRRRPRTTAWRDPRPSSAPDSGLPRDPTPGPAPCGTQRRRRRRRLLTCRGRLPGPHLGREGWGGAGSGPRTVQAGGLRAEPRRRLRG